MLDSIFAFPGMFLFPFFFCRIMVYTYNLSDCCSNRTCFILKMYSRVLCVPFHVYITKPCSYTDALSKFHFVTHFSICLALNVTIVQVYITETKLSDDELVIQTLNAKSTFVTITIFLSILQFNLIAIITVN